MKREANLEWVDEYLREWAFFFRDRQRLNTCRSIEHRFKATSDDFGADGWGDMDSAPKTQPAASYRVLRALLTHEAVQQLSKSQKWAVTYAYCYPSLPKFVVLRAIKKWTGRRMSWKDFLDQLDIARTRVYVLLLANTRDSGLKGLTA